MATAKSMCSPSNHITSKHSYQAEILRTAAAAGNVQEVVRLLGEGVKNLPDETGCNALHLAASAGHANTVAALILAGCDVNAFDLAGCTALQRAASQGHVTVVRQLLKHGADVNHQDNVHGNTALHEASWKGYSMTVAALCKGRAQLQLKNRGGFAALHLCCQNGHNQSCRELLFAGCNPDVQNNYGDTSLHTSARYGHAGVTRILISAQCRVSDQNKNGDTALHIAAAMGRKKLTRILLEAGCDKSLRNKQNETARDIATRKELSDILVILNTPVSMKAPSGSGKKCSQSNKHGRRKSGADQDAARTQEKDTNDRKREKNGSGTSSKESSSQRKDKKHKNAHKVHFEKVCAGNNGRQWSPYGCHYYPDPETFPAPNLDSLPDEPLQKGEQYFLDLAGNICKGPVGVGYTCYCAPFFRNVEARLERDKQELKEHIDRAHERLDKKVSSLEQRLSHTVEKEREHCEARSLRLAEWLCRELSSFDGHNKCHDKDFHHVIPCNRTGDTKVRRTKSLEILPNEPVNTRVSQEVPCGARSESFGVETTQVDQWHRVVDDMNAMPENSPGKSNVLLPMRRQIHGRLGRQSSVDSLDRVCKIGWNLNRQYHMGQENSNEKADALLKTDADDHGHSESSDGEGDVGHEVPSSFSLLGLRCTESLEVEQERDSQLVPDYENIVSCEQAIWKNGREKLVLSGLPFKSRVAVYESKILGSAAISSDYHGHEADVHNDSGYSTKVYGSSKGPSPSLSGNMMESEGPVPTSDVNPTKISNGIVNNKKQFIGYSENSIRNENENNLKPKAPMRSGFKMNGGTNSGSIV